MDIQRLGLAIYRTKGSAFWSVRALNPKYEFREAALDRSKIMSNEFSGQKHLHLQLRAEKLVQVFHNTND